MSRLKYPKQISDKYYIQQLNVKQGTIDFLEMKSKDVTPYTFKTYPFFIHRPYILTEKSKKGYKFAKEGWQISDALTGRRVYWLTDDDVTQEQLITAFEEYVAKWEKRGTHKLSHTISNAIQSSVESTGVSPRYEEWNMPRKFYDEFGFDLKRPVTELSQVAEYNQTGFYYHFGVFLKDVWKNGVGLDIEKFLSEVGFSVKNRYLIFSKLEEKFGIMGTHYFRQFVS